MTPPTKHIYGSRPSQRSKDTPQTNRSRQNPGIERRSPMLISAEKSPTTSYLIRHRPLDPAVSPQGACSSFF